MSIHRAFAIILLVSCLLSVRTAIADRRAAGMSEGETAVQAIPIAPAADAAFYRGVERRLQTAAQNMQFADYVEARINIRWAEAKLRSHGQSTDKELAVSLTQVLSFIRHYQIGQAMALLRSVTGTVHGMGWGSAVAVNVPVSAPTAPGYVKEIDTVITQLKNKQVSLARSSLQAVTKNVSAKASSINTDVLRQLRGLNLHFEQHANDRQSLIESLEALKGDLSR